MCISECSINPVFKSELEDQVAANIIHYRHMPHERLKVFSQNISQLQITFHTALTQKGARIESSVFSLGFKRLVLLGCCVSRSLIKLFYHGMFLQLRVHQRNQILEGNFPATDWTPVNWKIRTLRLTIVHKTNHSTILKSLIAFRVET